MLRKFESSEKINVGGNLNAKVGETVVEGVKCKLGVPEVNDNRASN